MKIPQDKINTIYECAVELITQFANFASGLTSENNGYTTSESIEMAMRYVCAELRKYDNAYKRQKQVESRPNYVKPQEFAIGTHFEMKRLKNCNVSVPRCLQSKGYYIPITQTVRSLFLNNEAFRNVYMKYNGSEPDHVCEEGVYRGFCCGSVFKENALYKKHPNSLQIRIASDDFEIANPLGPSSKVQKLTAVYFSIQNVPAEFLSKLNNIHVVALIHADDIKTKETDFNDIWRMVVTDIKYLEQFGIQIDEEHTIRGTIAYGSFDNLGANQALGLTESFQSNFFCRICKLSKKECQKKCEEDKSEYRNMEDYKKILDIIENATKVNLAETYGVKRYCVLNDLAFFKTFINFAVDIMHDCNEGVIKFLLELFFELLKTLKIFNESTLEKKVQFFDYGDLHSKTVPKLDSFNKLTAAQMMCLFLHLPFIFNDLRNNEQLEDVWKCVQSLLKIVQIVHSKIITEENLKDLDYYVRLHLELIQKIFKRNLIPKHHFLTHYATIIRLMGPLIFMSPMRCEGKHQHLKRLVETSRNFTNVPKSITKQHQAQYTSVENSYVNDIKCGEKKPFQKDDSLENQFISEQFLSLDDLFVIPWFSLNSTVYKKNLFVISDRKFCQIENLYTSINEQYISCIQWDYICFDEFLNSLQITKSEPNVRKLINFAELKEKQVFECKRLNNRFYVIADTLLVKMVM